MKRTIPRKTWPQRIAGWLAFAATIALAYLIRWLLRIQSMPFSFDFGYKALVGWMLIFLAIYDPCERFCEGLVNLFAPLESPKSEPDLYTVVQSEMNSEHLPSKGAE